MVLWQDSLYRMGRSSQNLLNIIMPFNSFRNQAFTGYVKSFNKIPYDNFIRLASLTLEGEQFGAPGIQDYQKAGLD